MFHDFSLLPIMHYVQNITNKKHDKKFPVLNNRLINVIIQQSHLLSIKHYVRLITFI